MIFTIMPIEEETKWLSSDLRRWTRFFSKDIYLERGQIGFNQGAVERYGSKDKPFVVIYYEKEHKKIGFGFTNKQDESGAIKIHLKATGGMVSAKSFLDYYVIDYKKTRTYDVSEDDSGLVVIDLKQRKEQ